MSEVLPAFNSLFDHVEAMGKMIDNDRFYDIEKVIRQDLFNQKLPLNAVYNLEDLVNGTDDAITKKQDMSDAHQPAPSTQRKRPKKNGRNTTQSKVSSKRKASPENTRKSTRSKKQRVLMYDLHVDTTDEDDDLDAEKPIEDLDVMNENVENETSSEDEDSDQSKNNSHKEDVSDSEEVFAEMILYDSSDELPRDMCNDLSGENSGKSNRRIEWKDISDDELFASVSRVAWVLIRKHYN
jgi:hypothetical protein